MTPRRLLSLCLLLPFAACSGEPEEREAPSAPLLQNPQPHLVTGARAIELLDGPRRELLAKLQAASDVPVEIVLDARTLSVVSISGHIPTKGDKLAQRATSFVTIFQVLLDPRIPSSEYVVADQDPSCYASTVVFDRQIKDLRVLGSRLTIHFDATGAIESVTNGVAPVPSAIVEIDASSFEDARPLADLLGGPEVPTTRVDALVPSPDGGGVVAAQLVSWIEAGPKGPIPVAVVALGDIAITGKLKVVTPVSRAPVTPTKPRFLDKDGLPLPEFITYRDIGGVTVNRFPWEHNPVEMAYRFLEEHPSLMRSFAARCQFAPSDVSEDPAAPGVYFVKVRQKYGPLPVFASELVLVQEGLGKVTSVAGRTLPKIEAAETPLITVKEAIDRADQTLQQGAAQDPQYATAVTAALQQPAKVTLGVLPGHKQDPAVGTGKERLAYEVQRGPYVFYVDTETGKAIGSQALTAHANIVTDGLGGNELGWPFVRDEVDGIPTGMVSPRSFDNLPGRPGGTAGASVAAVAAFYGSLGWVGSNNRGADWIANTNVTISTGCPNAFFDPILTGQTFFCPGQAANDIVGHELTHGVVWAGSRLWFTDQAGALQESYADLMGNLVFPGDWRVGELAIGGPFRSMASPAVGHMAFFRSRDATCSIWPWSCDFGFVHTNSGIVNRAHVLLTDGIPGQTTGIGGLKMKQLAHTTMTRRIFSDARLNDAAVATRDVCEMFVARGVTVTDPTGTAIPFTLADCDQVTAAFNQVGLNGQLDTGWQEPTLGFAGTRVFFGAGETTPGGCPVSNVVADLATISGDRSADLNPGTPLPTSVSYYFGAHRIALRVSGGVLPIPLGTSMMFHIVDWSNVWGVEPPYATRVVSAPTCAPPVNQITRTSATFVTPNNLFGASGTNFIGTTASSWGPGCTLVDTNVELVDTAGNTIAGPSHAVLHRITHWFFNLPINYDIRASISTPASGGPTGNLAAAVAWNYHIGRGPARIRLRYTIDQAAGSVCAP